MRYLLIVVLLCGFALKSKSQFIDNESLEGTPGTQTPVNWFSCLASSTVDIGPGVWGITQPAQDGNTYINMVCRGPEQPNAGSCEELSQTLKTTLESGKCYRFEVYLSFFPNFQISQFRNPLDLIINAGTDACTRSLEIGRYESVNHEDWRRYVTYINPSQNLDGMLLEVDWHDNGYYSGHMLVDNMSIAEITNPPTRQLTLCEGESIRLSSFLRQDATAFSWSNGSTEAFTDVDAPGTYSVDVSLGNCIITETFEVAIQESPDLILTDVTGLCPEEEITLSATLAGASYEWDNGSTSPTRSITGPGNYSVSVTIGECVSEYSINLLPLDCPPVLEMPNAFSPNDDGKNDILTPIRTEYIRSMNTVIYNRWGDEVYSTSNLQIAWDGTLPNGEPAPASTYYYRVVYTGLLGNSFNSKGTVTILK